LAFSMPVFITPPGAKYKLDCTVARTSVNSVNALCANTGNAYAQPLGFVLSSSAGDKLGSHDIVEYILPGIKHGFDIKSDRNIPAGKAKLAVRLDDGTEQTFDVMIPE
jgi:fimbrial chaperone protein